MIDPRIETVTVTTGRATSHLGDTVRVVAAIAPSHDLTHAASGDVLAAFVVEREAPEGQEIAFDLPATDQPGILDAAGRPITGWHYVVTVSYSWPAREGVTPRVIRRRIAPVMGQGTIDLDTLPSGEALPEPETILTPAVTSVEGRSGAVSLLDLYTPRIEGLGAARTVLGRDAHGRLVAVNGYDTNGSLLATTVLIRDAVTDDLAQVVETYPTHTVTTTILRDALGTVTEIERTTDYGV